MRAVLGIRGEPLRLVVTRWRRAIPQYSTRLPRVWQRAREMWCAALGRVLFGNYTGQVSLRGMIETVNFLPNAHTRKRKTTITKANTIPAIRSAKAISRWRCFSSSKLEAFSLMSLGERKLIFTISVFITRRQ